MTLTPQNVVAWHDKTPDQHKALVGKWSTKNFRMMSLSLYGATLLPLFAAVMVKRKIVIENKQVGPLDQVGMQKAIDKMGKGWGPAIVTATGPSSSALFAAVFTPMDSNPLARLNMTAKQFTSECVTQHTKGNILVWADVFGTTSNKRYTGIWGPNPSKHAWSCDPIDDDGDNLQARFEALRSAWERPAHIAVTPSGSILELFVDSTVGPWFSKVGMSEADFKQTSEKEESEGRQPVRISGQITESGARFAAIFASREETDPRVFRTNGPRTVSAIDDAMESYIKAQNLRGAALAITRGPQLVYAKGYTWAESTYPDVLPTTLFRQASISKTFTALAIWRLMQMKPKELSFKTPMQSILKLKQFNGSAPMDSRYSAIRVQHLLESTSGLDQNTVWDFEEVAEAAGSKLPATQEEMARFSTAFMLSAAPGDTTNANYGSYDYFLLSQIVAKLAGTSTFEAALKKLVLTPLTCKRTRSAVSLVGKQAADEARYQLSLFEPKKGLIPLQISPSVKSPAQPIVPTQYGSWDMELFDGAAGLSSAVIDVARLAAMFSVRAGNPLLKADTIDQLFEAAATATHKYSGPDAHGYHGFDWVDILNEDEHIYQAEKGGSLSGLSTVITFTTGGYGYVIAQNSTNIDGVTLNWRDVEPIAEAHLWSGNDLFPHYGMPSFKTESFKPVATKHAKGRTPATAAAMVERSMATLTARAVPPAVR
jgi:CubicO group peptidase (beta-lactamase class C family)